jgi:hypothetical protein
LTADPDDPNEPAAPSPRRALIGLLILAAAVVAVLFVMRELQRAARIQDCVASGRTNCAPIDASPGR